jgi:hypothetical protein
MEAACCQFPTILLLVLLFFDLEDGDDMFSETSVDFHTTGIVHSY